MNDEERNRKDEIDRVKGWIIAYLAAQKWPLRDIAVKLNVTAGTVSRWIKKSDDFAGYHVTAFNAEDAPWDEMQSQMLVETAKGLSLKGILDDPSLGKHLSKESFRDILCRVSNATNLNRVIICGNSAERKTLKEVPRAGDRSRPVTSNDWTKDDPAIWERRLKAFGRSAAPHLNRLLQHSKAIGVTWGATLSFPITELYCQRLALPKRKRKLIVAATVGEAIGNKQQDRGTSSSGLAHRLGGAYGQELVELHELRGIPAVLPFSFDDIAAAKKGYRGFPNYQKVFDEQGLCLNLDTVLTSVGNVFQSGKLHLDELKAGGGYTANDLSGLKRYGDIGGALIEMVTANPYEDDRGEIIAKQVNERWMGMKLADYERLAKRFGADNKTKSDVRPAGVVVFAIGHNKRDIVLTCLRRNIINTLLIDDDLAFALLGAPKPRRGVQS